MKRTLISELRSQIGQTVQIKAIVDVRRDQGKMAFFDFRDRSGIVQGVVFGKPEVLEIAKEASNESSVTVEGVVNQRPEKMVNDKVQNGDIELEITAITILNKAESMPFELDSDYGIEVRLDNRPLTLKSKRDRAVFKIQNEITRGYAEFLRSQGFTEFQAPKLVGGDAEGGAAVFKVPYFRDTTAYLASSPQFYKQILVGSLERVFTFATAFRAEKSATTRHLSEYTSLDAEVGFIEDHHDLMKILTGLMRHLKTHLEATCASEFVTLGIDLPKIPTDGETFPFMKLREAQALIKEKTGVDKTSEPDLEPEDERWLCEYANQELGSDYIFITHYPVSKRPFYTYEDEADHGFTKSFDLLFRGVEITTGGQRVHNYDNLIERMKMKGLDPDKFGFYLQAFRYGIPPHGGWGMGLERLTQKFCGLDNVKEATLFPRDINRIDVFTSSTQSDEADI
ncbi:MAG: aspartate--tRNA(Asn) ligase [Candidatus Pacebacteria bacterium]|jgi:nondiscriminating aspartyl-tRNA synthetase|nr:aspartate--tRNA(Asn) ligase [Candidatus Paceibacterota bacterium]